MRVVKEVVIWQPILEGRRFAVPITVVRHPRALKKGETQLHFYPGLGEEVRLTTFGIKTLADCSLPAVGVVIPFHYLPPTYENIQRTLTEVPLFIAETYNQKAGNPIDMPVDLIGKSQGGGAVLLAAAFKPERYRIIASLIPAGLNTLALGKTAQEKRRQLKWRFGVLNNLHREQSIIHPRNIVAWYEVMRRVTSDALHRRLNLKLDYTLSMDLTNLPAGFISLQELARTHDVAIFAGKKDPIVRLEEVRGTLESIGLERLLHEVPSIHANLAGRAGQSQIQIVAQWLSDSRVKIR